MGRGAGGRPAAGGRARSEAEGRGAEVSRGHGDAAAALSEADEGRKLLTYGMLLTYAKNQSISAELSRSL